MIPRPKTLWHLFRKSLFGKVIKHTSAPSLTYILNQFLTKTDLGSDKFFCERVLLAFGEYPHSFLYLLEIRSHSPMLAHGIVEDNSYLDTWKIHYISLFFRI